MANSGNKGLGMEGETVWGLSTWWATGKRERVCAEELCDPFCDLRLSTWQSVGTVYSAVAWGGAWEAAWKRGEWWGLSKLVNRVERGRGPRRWLSSSHSFFQWPHFSLVPDLFLGCRDTRQIWQSLFAILLSSAGTLSVDSPWLPACAGALPAAPQRGITHAPFYFLLHFRTITYLTECLPFPHIVLIRTGTAVFVSWTIAFTKHSVGSQ